MAAEPLPDVHEDPEDPEVILLDLPERERANFLRQYQAEVAGAAADPARYRLLRKLLHDWSIRVIAVSRPGYYEAIEAARDGREPGIPAEDVIPGWNERIEAARAARA